MAQIIQGLLEVHQYDDEGDLFLFQYESPTENKFIYFGPIFTTLFDLIERHEFYFYCRVTPYQLRTDRKVKVYLRAGRGKFRYKIAKIRASKAIKLCRFDHFIKENHQLGVSIPSESLEKEETGDIFKPIFEKYPVKKKRKKEKMDIFIGNRTLREYLTQEMV